jgi:hypothetical protein
LNVFPLKYKKVYISLLEEISEMENNFLVNQLKEFSIQCVDFAYQLEGFIDEFNISGSIKEIITNCINDTKLISETVTRIFEENIFSINSPSFELEFNSFNISVCKLFSIVREIDSKLRKFNGKLDFLVDKNPLYKNKKKERINKLTESYNPNNTKVFGLYINELAANSLIVGDLLSNKKFGRNLYPNLSDDERMDILEKINNTNANIEPILEFEELKEIGTHINFVNNYLNSQEQDIVFLLTSSENYLNSLFYIKKGIQDYLDSLEVFGTIPKTKTDNFIIQSENSDIFSISIVDKKTSKKYIIVFPIFIKPNAIHNDY